MEKSNKSTSVIIRIIVDAILIFICSIFIFVFFAGTIAESAKYLIGIAIFAALIVLLSLRISKLRKSMKNSQTNYINNIQEESPEKRVENLDIQNGYSKNSYISNSNQSQTVAKQQSQTFEANVFRDYFKTTVLSGLPIPSGTKCNLYIYSDSISCVTNATTFSVKADKIISITVDKSTEIQKQAVFSVGGAIAGGMMFGGIGAVIGGRAKTKNIKTKTIYFSILYKDKNNKIQNIILEPNKNDVMNLRKATKQYSATVTSDTGSVEL